MLETLNFCGPDYTVNKELVEGNKIKSLSMKVKETTTLKKQNFVRSFKLTDEIPIGQI